MPPPISALFWKMLLATISALALVNKKTPPPKPVAVVETAVLL